MCGSRVGVPSGQADDHIRHYLSTVLQPILILCTTHRWVKDGYPRVFADHDISSRTTIWTTAIRICLENWTPAKNL